MAGLSQAHRQGVMHGDSEARQHHPGSLPEGGVRAVITDFGLAKLGLTKIPEPGGLHMMSGRGGTRAYMAPELFLGERASVASDIYALGVLIHELRTGYTPVRDHVARTSLYQRRLAYVDDDVRSQRLARPDRAFAPALAGHRQTLYRPETGGSLCISGRDRGGVDSAAFGRPRLIGAGVLALCAVAGFGMWRYEQPRPARR